MIGSHLSRWRWPVLLVAVFIGAQLQAINYGTKINDAPHIRDYLISSDMITGSALERDRIVGAGAGESLDRWMTRFKLYSVEADEHVNILALSRIKPDQGLFDPHFYQYGGAWLYPLGAWYFALSKLGAVSVAPLTTYLQQPGLMDNVYIWGRILVLISISGAALILFAACRRFLPNVDSLMCMLLFLAAPGTIMFSQIMKPHWYALIWVCSALFILTRGPAKLSWRSWDTFLLGVFLGLAVGSVLTFGLFAALCWFALLVFVSRSQVPNHALIFVPLIATGVYLITNPFVLLNWSTFSAEASIVGDWFSLGLDFGSVLSFLDNSLLPSFGIGTVLMITGVGIYHVRSAAKLPLAWFLIAAAGIVIFIAFLTASIATWHTNSRYIAYLLPSGILFLAIVNWPRRRTFLAIALVLTIVQSAPLALAYHDENSPIHSTRLAAAHWVHENVPANSAICVGTKTAAPYDVPPVDFTRYLINHPSCNLKIVIERSPDSLKIIEGMTIEKRFQPRFSPQHFPLVFSHINPQISIYRRADTN